MGWQTLTDKVVKIRKPHRCFLCGTKTEPPATMRYVTGVYDGDMHSSYSCNCCDSFMTRERWREIDNEMGDGEIWEFPDYKAFRESFLSKTVK